MVRATALTLLIASLGSNAAIARDWPKTSGWDVGQLDDACAISSSFEGKGDSELTLFLNLDGTAGLHVTNAQWSAKKGEAYELTYIVNGHSYSGNSIGIGDSYDSRKGFVATLPRSFVEDVRKSSNLVIKRGDATVDSLSMDGSSAALLVAERCVSAVRADVDAATREKRRFSDIADDPFAQKPPHEPSPVAGGSKLISQWITVDDYPPSSLRALEEGTVTVRFDLDSTGRPVNCSVLHSSGASALDRATCAIITRRGRLPVASGDGAPRVIEGSYSWKIP